MTTIRNALNEYEARYPEHALELSLAKTDLADIKMLVDKLQTERMTLIREIAQEGTA